MEASRCRALFTAIWIAALALAITAAGYLLSAIAPVESSVLASEVAEKFIRPHGFRPKPYDKFLFSAVVLSGAALMMIAAVIWKMLSGPAPTGWMFSWFCLIGVGGVLLWNGVPEVFLPITMTAALTIGVCVIATAALLTFLPREYGNTLALFCCTMMIATIEAKYRVFSAEMLRYDLDITSHYEAAIYSIVHVVGGGTCLANVPTQYGCYSEFLLPIFKLVGLSTWNITATMSVLTCISLIIVLVYATTIIGSPGLLLACGATLCIQVYIILFLGSPDAYLQYYPIRFLFPALSLLVVLWLQGDVPPLRAALAGCFAAVVVAWNLDSGAAVAIALLIFVMMPRLTQETVRRPDFVSTSSVFT